MNGPGGYRQSGGGGVRPQGGRYERPQRDRDGPPGPSRVAELWPDYLKGGYFDEQGHLRIEYVSRDKVEPLAQAMSAITSHQIRRYFGHCRALETRLRCTDAAWGALWPEVKKLDIAAADAAAKDSPKPKIPILFRDFIQRNVDSIKCQKDFLEGFLPHFEAVVGFGQAYFRKERG
jgi:CRISPR type III-A-associated protein Csm2